MAVNPNSSIYKSFSISTRDPTAMPMPNPKETGSEEDGDLRKKTLSEQSIEEARKAKLEELVKAIKERSVFFSGDSSESQEQKKTKLSLVRIFCEQSEEFNTVINSLEKASTFLKLPQIAKSFAEGLDKYFSSPEEKTYNFIRVRGFNPNEIKLNGKENLVDQLEKEGVDLKFIEDKIKKCARYLDKDLPHFVLMVLPDGRFFNIDINQYDRDKQQNLNEGPPSGPQKRSREQPDDEAQQNSKRLRSMGDKENTSPQKSGDAERRQQGIRGILRNANSPKELDPKPNVRFGPPQFSPSEKSWTQRTSDNRSGGTDGRSP